jgi:hypothetical protein
VSSGRLGEALFHPRFVVVWQLQHHPLVVDVATALVLDVRAAFVQRDERDVAEVGALGADTAVHVLEAESVRHLDADERVTVTELDECAEHLVELFDFHAASWWRAAWRRQASMTLLCEV